MSLYGLPTVAWAGGLVAVVVAGVCAVGYATAADAAARGVDSPRWWGVVCGLVAPAAVGYWWRRGRSGPRTWPPTRAERVARSVAVGVAAALLLPGVFGPPDALTQSVYTVAGTALAVPLVYLVLTGRAPTG